VAATFGPSKTDLTTNSRDHKTAMPTSYPNFRSLDRKGIDLEIVIQYLAWGEQVVALFGDSYIKT
jgi:hypothetical protein